MKIAIKRFSRRAVCAAVLSTACFSGAHAATIVYEDVDFIKGSDTRSESFLIKQAGSYQVTLSDFQFPKSFTELDLLIGTSVAPNSGSIHGPGTFSFNATPGTYWANVFGIADKPFDIGLYGIRIEQISMSPVPLPASILLLGSALVAFVSFGRGGLVSRSQDNGDGKLAGLYAA